MRSRNHTVHDSRENGYHAEVGLAYEIDGQYGLIGGLGAYRFEYLLQCDSFIALAGNKYAPGTHF